MSDGRREEMLAGLLEAMRARHRRRRAARGTLAVLGVVLAAGAAWVAAGHLAAPPVSGRRTAVAAVRVTILHGCPRTGLISEMDDDQLLDRLAEIDRPSGLVRLGGQAWVVSERTARN
jgi:anti-sigma factor RsiW